VYDTVFLISFSDCSLCIESLLIFEYWFLYPATLWHVLMRAKSFACLLRWSSLLHSYLLCVRQLPFWVLLFPGPLYLYVNIFHPLLCELFLWVFFVMQAWWIWTALACPCLGRSYFCIKAKEQLCWIKYSWLAAILSQSFNYIAPCFLGFWGLCWEV
jgi:hypothetical protein